jgi:hypothetical protein
VIKRGIILLQIYAKVVSLTKKRGQKPSADFSPAEVFVSPKKNPIFNEPLPHKGLRDMRQAMTSIYRFYVDGFKQMTWGRQLWWLILLKVIILFLVLRVFFFKPILAGKSEIQRIEHVSNELTK